MLRARSDELSADLSLAHVWDFTRLSISLGASAGPSWLRQRFDTPGRAPGRDSLALNLGALLGGAIALTHGYYTFAEAQGQVLRAAPRPRRR